MTIGRRKFRLPSFILCAGTRCASSRSSIGLTTMAQKKKYLDWIASRHLETGRYDLFHSWSGDCLRSLRMAKQRRIPSIIEIPTWHRDGKKAKTEIPHAAASASNISAFQKWKAGLLLD